MTRALLRVLGLLLIASAVAVALSRAPDRTVESLVARWAPSPSDFLMLKGQLVHWRDEGPRGDPAPVVLLHGTASGLHTWEGWVATLRKTRRVITFDLPGFGLTGPFAGSYAADDYRGDTYARFVLDLLDHLQLQRVALGGNSLGGEIAWRVATLAPQRVERLVLVDAAGYAFAPGGVPFGFMVARFPVLNRIGEHLLPRALVATSVNSVYGDPARVTEALVDRYFELTLREGNRRALGLRMQQLEAGEHVGRLKSLTLPTLVLWGDRDRLIPPETARRFAADIRGSKLVVFDGLGHVPHEEDAARTVQPVLEFLSGEEGAMSDHRYTAIIEWADNAAPADFSAGRYSRRHTLRFDGGAVVTASAAQANVPLPWSDPAGVDPEEAFVASLASCHMLWFLALAAKSRYAVASYRDEAEGVMSPNAQGKLWVCTVTLHPHAAFAGERQPTREQLLALHHRAHEECFIANSVKTEVRCEPG